MIIDICNPINDKNIFTSNIYINEGISNSASTASKVLELIENNNVTSLSIYQDVADEILDINPKAFVNIKNVIINNRPDTQASCNICIGYLKYEDYYKQVKKSIKNKDRERIIEDIICFFIFWFSPIFIICAPMFAAAVDNRFIGNILSYLSVMTIVADIIIIIIIKIRKMDYIFS